jgi:hypothetical protein
MGFTGCSPICGQTIEFQGGAFGEFFWGQQSGLSVPRPTAVIEPTKPLFPDNGKRITKKFSIAVKHYRWLPITKIDRQGNAGNSCATSKLAGAANLLCT